MGLDSIIRSGVKTIDRVTKSLQPTVTHRAWTGADVYGSPHYAGAVAREAIVEQKQELRKTSSGQLVLTKASVMFIYPIPPNGAAGRVEPVDPRDIITLADGTTGTIVDVSGFVDRVTKHPFFSEVWLA